MCGILFSVAFRKESFENDLIERISFRGPDSLGTHRIHLSDDNSKRALELTFTSSVLHLRGQQVTKQPLVSGSGDVLCWNGEIWQGLDVQDDENDGVALLEALIAEERVWDVMGKLEGPWAMVFYSANKNKLWYGRDCLGRRSLLCQTVPDNQGLRLSSVGVDMLGWEEVGVNGLWCIDLNDWIKKDKQVLMSRPALIAVSCISIPLGI